MAAAMRPACARACVCVCVDAGLTAQVMPHIAAPCSEPVLGAVRAVLKDRGVCLRAVASQMYGQLKPVL